MKKNWMKTCSLLWAVVAVVLFAGAGIIFNVFHEALDQMIVLPIMLIAVGFFVATFSCVYAYKAGKGEILTVPDLRQEISRLRGQALTVSGKAILTIEYANSEIRSVENPAPLKEPLPEYVMPDHGSLVSADFYKYEKPVKPTQSSSKPSVKSRLTPAPPKDGDKDKSEDAK